MVSHDGSAAVAQVRRFNRIVTERVGALNDHFLARDRPLGEARLLWEIGEAGCDVRSLRTRLGLDSGYVSRMLRSLESAGLVTVCPGASDKRVRSATLTERGSAERAVLDRRSDDFAASVLAALDSRQRAQLVEAMSDVERLLTASMVQIDVTDPKHLDARHCMAAYFAELDERFDVGFEAEQSLPADAGDLRPPAGLLLVARLRGRPIGCAAIKFHGDDPAEIKRMWVDREARGLGLGRRLLREIERAAAERGVTVLHLETNRSLHEAIALYRSCGYIEVEPFNDEPYAHHWFEKGLRPDCS
jgi:DNA-binding MarR family transcriptional regulator/GNAT superfamily N-acetyltransferase